MAELPIDRGSSLEARATLLRNLRLRVRRLHRVRDLAAAGDLPALVALEGAAHRRLRADTPVRLRHWLRAIALQTGPDAARFLTGFYRQACRDDAGRRRTLVHTYDELPAALDAPPAFAELRRLVKAEVDRDRGRLLSRRRRQPGAHPCAA